MIDPNGENNLKPPGSHIYTVLRVDKEKKRIQTFEAGGPTSAEADKLPGPDWNPIDRAPAFGEKSARHETRWMNTADKGPCALGIAPTPGDLDKAVAHMMRARPVGLARLAIQYYEGKGKDPRVVPVYISSFLRMWGRGELDNYAPSRFLLSLRSTPYFQGRESDHARLQAYWFLYLPRNYLAWEMWQEGARDKHVSDFFEAALRKEWQTQEADARRLGQPLPVRRTRLSHTDLRCVLVLSHDDKGFAEVRWRHEVKGTTLDAVEQTWTMTKIDGLEQIMQLPLSASDDLMPGLDVRWDGEYFHPSLRPGGRHAPAFFDFEHMFAPGPDQC